MERKTTPVTVDNDGFSHHPSFGTIAVSRVNGSYPRKFFGSDVEPCNYIEIVIRDAEQQRSLNNDWVIGRNQIISLRLTPLQYAEMLTNLNCGTGVPCTIEFIRGEGTIPEAEIKSKIDILHEESDARFDTTLDILDEVSKQLKELSQSGKLSKRVETELTRKLGIASYNLSTRETYYKKQAREEIAKMTTEAKAEVSAFVEHKIYSTGLSALKDGYRPPELFTESTKQIEEKSEELTCPNCHSANVHIVDTNDDSVPKCVCSDCNTTFYNIPWDNRQKEEPTCPKCGSHSYTVESMTSTGVYYPTTVIDGKVQDTGRNTITEMRKCLDCGTEYNVKK